MAPGVDVVAVSTVFNGLSVVLLLFLFAVLRNKPGNRPVYFCNLDHGRGHRAICSIKQWRTYYSWIPEALRMSEREIIEQAGLDSAVYLRIYTLGLRIFSPIMVVALLVLLPINASGDTSSLSISGIDKLSILNVSPGSNRFFIHIAMAYVFTIWTCFVLYKEYSHVAFMRSHFMASHRHDADKFTVLVRNIPGVSCHSTSETVEQFFLRNHPHHYLGHQAVYKVNKYSKLVKRKERLLNWLDYYQLKFRIDPTNRPSGRIRFFGLCGGEVDMIDYYRTKIIEVDTMIASERERVLSDSTSILPVAFVTFDSRRCAAVCAQTQQSNDPTKWMTDWAPEPRDIYWQNLAIPFISQSIRKFLILTAVLVLLSFYMVPIALVHAIFDIDVIAKAAPFLRPIKEVKVVKSFIEGFLPNLLLDIFLNFLQKTLMVMSKAEGHFSLSSIERRATSKYYYFLIINVFFGSLVAGMALNYSFSHGPPAEHRIVRAIGLVVAEKASFFITYMMVDGWAGIAYELLRLKPLVTYHLKNKYFVKTERDRQRAMDPGSIALWKTLPSLQLYFLIGLVYTVVAPILIPFVTVFFAFAFVVYRNQIMNVFNQKHESAAAFWPHMHSRIISSLIISHVILFGLLSNAMPIYYTPLLIFLPVTTISFHKYCKVRFEPAFSKFPLEEATEMDHMEPAMDPSNLKRYLERSYLHPVFHAFEQEDHEEEVGVYVRNDQ